jgi:Fe(3+) dicitrate transport protein
MQFDNRIEAQAPPPGPGVNPALDTIAVNTGSTRHRGIEGEVAYDFLAPFQQEPVATVTDSKDAKDAKSVMRAPREWHPLQLIVFTNVQVLDAEFTDSLQFATIAPGVTKSFVGNAPAYAPDLVIKGGITFKRDKCFNITLSAVHVSEQFWQDSNLAGNPQPTSVPIPAEIPSYDVFNLSGEFYVTRNVRLIGGISNLGDEKYYSRVFPFGGGSIDPAPGRSGYVGVSVEF